MKQIKTPDDMLPGTIYTTKHFGNLSVIKYNGTSDVLVLFLSTGYEIVTRASSIRGGQVKDPLYPRIYGVGYIGLGDYKQSEKGKKTKSYKTWSGMLERCYSELSQVKNTTYIECSTSKEWHNYQNFAKWFDDNYIDGYHLDKDILNQGNKVYSPDNCIFVPQQVNSLLTDRRAKRGNYAIGVSVKSGENRFRSGCSRNGKYYHVGYYSTEIEAHNAYKSFKYNTIAELAEKQEEPLKSALLAYRIE